MYELLTSKFDNVSRNGDLIIIKQFDIVAVIGDEITPDQILKIKEENPDKLFIMCDKEDSIKDIEQVISETQSKIRHDEKIENMYNVEKGIAGHPFLYVSLILGAIGYTICIAKNLNW